ncbi:MAG: PGN_0703 family putative restriction endonuclease [Solirubrobacteraceae bacterium]
MFEQDRQELLLATVSGLEGALPAGTPARAGSGRAVWDVLCEHLRVGDVRSALGAIARGPGGELAPSAAGNVPFCSAESSALMTVNFLAPFSARGQLLGLGPGALVFERELRVQGVRAPVGPTLDAVLQVEEGALAVEVKTAEPWRKPPSRAISSQYDAVAESVSPGVIDAVGAVRENRAGYMCLDAAQLLKHLLGIHSAVRDGRLRGPVRLVVLYWRPSRAGDYEAMFDRFEAELDDFAQRVGDQLIAVSGITTRDLLAQWSDRDYEPWLREHAQRLRMRYDPDLSSATGGSAGA